MGPARLGFLGQGVIFPTEEFGDVVGRASFGKCRAKEPPMGIRQLPQQVMNRVKSCRRQVRYWCQSRIRRVSIDAPPTFIVACGHSGTSLLLAILGTHARMFAVPFESNMAASGDKERFEQLAKQFDKSTITAGKFRWIEKTPTHIYCIENILSWCPDARILLIVRDGRDVACSIRDRTGSLEDGIKRWVTDNQAAQPFWHLPNVHVLKYEDIIGNFESTIRSAVEFLDEEYDENLQNYHRIPRKWYSGKIKKPESAFGDNHADYRNWQINQPLFDGRGKWQEKLSSDELAMVEDVAGELLLEFGYGPPSDQSVLQTK